MGKNLANCKPSEFLKQTYRIKKSVERWMTDTDILNIRKNIPALTPVTRDMTDEDRRRVLEENKKKSQAQIRANAMAILDAIMDAHADETLELLALCCFVEPAEVDDHPIDFYLDNFADLISNKSVIGFFTSLAQLGVTSTPGA
jgi:hypothetical protein